MLRLLICDDSPVTRELLRARLAGHPEIEIVGEAENGEEAVSLAVATEPDVVLMDVQMPVLDGVTATRRIRRILSKTRIVGYAGSDDSSDVMAMMNAGAESYCLKGAPLWELERTIAGASDPLVRLAHGLGRSVKKGGAAEIVARELADLTGAAFAGVYLASSELTLSLAALAGSAAPEALRSAPSLAARAFSELRFVHAHPHELSELCRLGGACSEALAAPLIADGQPLGALLVVMPANIQLDSDPELIADVADLASVSIANERRLAFTYAEARRDALTGLANRRAFDEQLESAIQRGAELRDQVSLVFFDLDDFKLINDLEGHPVGDDVLRESGRVLLRALRAEDEVFRTGGEEFAVIINGDSEMAAGIVDRVRKAFAEQRRGHPLPTISGGVATFPVHAQSGPELVLKADVALYAAKVAGKDRVQIYNAEGYEEETGEPATEIAVTKVQRRASTSSLEDRGLRLLLVDDDGALRMLVRTTFEVVDIEVEEADSAATAEKKIASRAPDVVVLDVGMPGVDGLTFCRKLKANPVTSDIGILLLSGVDEATEKAGLAAGADAFLRKPFSPLELLSEIERVVGGLPEGPFQTAAGAPEEQLILYAQDLRRLLEIERGQRALLQGATRQTVTALACALESKDAGPDHSQRVQRYALELADAVNPRMLDDESVGYGFLLHDVGKVGIPDKILLKPRGSLKPAERRVVENHTILGEQMLRNVALVQGQGLHVVRSHHERWDGGGYPDKLSQAEIPLEARVFAVADALDALTSDRPHKPAGSWDAAVKEIIGEAARQFDPLVVAALRENQSRVRRVHYELSVSKAKKL